ncbi:MAG: hypothetical protein IPF81_17685 [Bacteroidetes bacterium]|nr:hypothetical protein [Bacteroidota bacterium]
MVVVPGVQFEDSSWSETMQARILWSKYLYDKGIAKNIMYSDHPFTSRITRNYHGTLC